MKSVCIFIIGQRLLDPAVCVHLIHIKSSTVNVCSVLMKLSLCLSSHTWCLSLLGGCTFDDGPAQCDYQQDLYDDFDWTHVSAQEVPYLPSDLPQGESITHAGLNQIHYMR